MALSRHSERLWIRAWLGFCVLTCAVLFWTIALGKTDPLIRDLEDHWIDRLEVGEALLEDGQEERAATYLKALEKQFPAKFIRHKFHRSRERLYAALGSAQAQLGRKSDALDTFRELTEYDERNWCNWELLALAYHSFGELELGLEAFEQLLAIHPNHLPTVTRLILADAEAGRCEQAVERYEEYLDAFLLARLDLLGDEVEEVLLLPVDGRSHPNVVLLHLTETPSSLRLALNGWSAELSPLSFSGPLSVGSDAPRPRLALTPSWVGEAATEARSATWSAAGPEALLTADLDASAWTADSPATLLEFDLTLYKAVSAELWSQVETCYTTLGDAERLARARARTVVGGCPEAGTFFEE